MRFLNSFQPLGLLILRAALGIIFFTHGFPKLMRGGGAMQEMFIQHGLPAHFVYVAGILETFGGLLLILGLFARGAALLLGIEMCVAIVKVHSIHGIMAVHEYEFPFALGAACFALATAGAGIISGDHLLFRDGGGNRARAAKASK